MPTTNNPLPPEQRAGISRRNGAKSRGPKSDAGKEKVSHNALKHGFASCKHHVTDDEDLAAYKALRDAYFERFAPEEPVEASLVDRLAYAAWRLRRAIDMDANSLNIGCAIADTDADEFFHDPGAQEVAHLGLKHCAFELDSIHRYELRAARIFSLSLKQLAELRTHRGLSPRPTSPVDPPAPPTPSGPAPETAAEPNKPTEHENAGPSGLRESPAASPTPPS